MLLYKGLGVGLSNDEQASQKRNVKEAYRRRRHILDVFLATPDFSRGSLQCHIWTHSKVTSRSNPIVSCRARPCARIAWQETTAVILWPKINVVTFGSKMMLISQEEKQMHDNNNGNPLGPLLLLLHTMLALKRAP